MAFFDWFRKRKDRASEMTPAAWVPATENRFGVEILDLARATGGYTSTSTDPEVAARAVSWTRSTGAELFTDFEAAASHSAAFEYPCVEELPNGLLFTPSAMEEKWVIAIRDNEIRGARSWTGDVMIRATVARGNGILTVSQIDESKEQALSQLGDPLQIFDWLMRTHALGQLLPLPVNKETAAQLQTNPLIAFQLFGTRAGCAALSWDPPPQKQKIRSDGALLLATRKEELDEVRTLVAAGEPIDSPSSYDGYTPLFIAAVKGHEEAIRTLLELGADPNRPADSGAVALLVALVHDASLDCLRLLVDGGANPAAVNHVGFGALHVVAETNHPRALSWLLELGLDLEARTVHGHTPIQIACGLGCLDAISALAAAGAEINAASPNGTAKEIALAEGHPEAAELIAGLS